MVSWIEEKENKGKPRNDLELIFSKAGSVRLQSCGSAPLVRRQGQGQTGWKLHPVGIFEEQ